MLLVTPHNYFFLWYHLDTKEGAEWLTLPCRITGIFSLILVSDIWYSDNLLCILKPPTQILCSAMKKKGTWERGEMHVDFQPGNVKRRNHLKRTGIDGKIKKKKNGQGRGLDSFLRRFSEQIWNWKSWKFGIKNVWRKCKIKLPLIL